MYIMNFCRKYSHCTAYITLLLVAIFMLGANPFKAETIAPMGLISSHEGWKNEQIYIKKYHPARGDILDAKLPRWLEAKHNIYKGDIPIWNYVTSGGHPSLFMFTESLVTPAFLVFALIPNDAIAFYWSNLINVLIGLIGMYLFLRIFFNTYAAIFGSIIFMFSGFNSAWFFWPHVNTAIWAPWILFTVYKYLDTKRLFYLPWITLSMTMLNLGGFPMVAVMTYMALAIFIIIILLSKKFSFGQNLKLLMNLLLFSIVSLCMSLPFVYPLIELFDWMGGIGYRHGGGYFPLKDIELFINPYLYNLPRVEKTLYVGIIPIIFLFVSMYFYKKNRRAIAKYGFVLFLFSITISFSLLNPDIIRMIPTLDKNIWSRFSFLIGLSLSIIAAYALNEIISKSKKKLWSFLLVIFVLSYQIVDQKELFQTFNSSVPNDSFYPNTPTLTYLKNNLLPFQYVLADGGYLNAGTLGAYGIPEWFSHGFHSPDEKKILKTLVTKPFQTPTSSVFLCSQIQLDSPYMVYLNNKYVACSMGTDYRILPWNNKVGFEPTPVLHENKIEQKFKLEKARKISAISLDVATHGHEHPSSDIALIIYKNEKVIGESIVKKENITDYSWIQFNFEEPLVLEKGEYKVWVKMVNVENPKNFSLWCNTNPQKYKLLVNGAETNFSLKIKLWEKNIIPQNYNILSQESNIVILDNIKVQGSAYFLKELNKDAMITYKNISVDMISNTRIHIEYDGGNIGWIILPMRSYPGWKVKVNGKDIEIKNFLDMLPAIKVNGKSDIIMYYEPSYWVYTGIISIMALLIVLYFFKRRIK